jgi:hypothetical protein
LSRVIDYAWSRPTVAALKAAGVVAVCRYLAYPGPSTEGKRLTASEAAGLNAGGIAVVSNWEQSGTWAEYSGGFGTGASHATEAARQHAQCGGPASRPIYFSVDFDATSSQLPTVAEYYRGVASVIGLNRTGAYGGYRTIRYLADHGAIRWAWQTYAWSGGLWDPRAHLRQTRTDVVIAGVACDLDESMTADFGQWGTGVPDMEQTDKLIHPSPNAPGRDLGSGWGDQFNMRDWLIGADTVAPGPLPGNAAYPTPSSPAARLIAAADKVLAGQPAPVVMTDAQLAALGKQISAAVVQPIADLTAAVKTLTDRIAAAGRALEGQ